MFYMLGNVVARKLDLEFINYHCMPKHIGYFQQWIWRMMCICERVMFATLISFPWSMKMTKSK